MQGDAQHPAPRRDRDPAARAHGADAGDQAQGLLRRAQVPRARVRPRARPRRRARVARLHPRAPHHAAQHRRAQRRHQPGREPADVDVDEHRRVPREGARGGAQARRDDEQGLRHHLEPHHGQPRARVQHAVGAAVRRPLLAGAVRRRAGEAHPRAEHDHGHQEQGDPGRRRRRHQHGARQPGRQRLRGAARQDHHDAHALQPPRLPRHPQHDYALAEPHQEARRHAQPRRVHVRGQAVLRRQRSARQLRALRRAQPVARGGAEGDQSERHGRAVVLQVHDSVGRHERGARVFLRGDRQEQGDRQGRAPADGRHPRPQEAGDGVPQPLQEVRLPVARGQGGRVSEVPGDEPDARGFRGRAQPLRDAREGDR